MRDRTVGDILDEWSACESALDAAVEAERESLEARAIALSEEYRDAVTLRRDRAEAFRRTEEARLAV